jgi:hypothetical protein
VLLRFATPLDPLTVTGASAEADVVMLPVLGAALVARPPAIAASFAIPC